MFCRNAVRISFPMFKTCLSLYVIPTLTPSDPGHFTMCSLFKALHKMYSIGHSIDVLGHIQFGRRSTAAIILTFDLGGVNCTEVK